ncbi:MAG: PLP-dependent aminotransferase family protein, partial [Proteobacteria bacterium]|nr:PLP-dependent aminotransferase family protein [Pseudomonadota bacterium]
MWIPTLSDQSLPRYRAIADAIADAVNSGDLSPGHRLPPQRQLAWKLGVTVGTIGRAYDLARQRGFVAGEVGRGTYVQIAPAERQPILSRDHIGNLIDLSLNQPASGRQAEQFRKTLTEVGATSELRDLMNYPPPAGLRRHREAAAAWVDRVGIETTAESIVGFNGTQEAIASAILAFTRAGDPVLVEELTYVGFIGLIEHFNRRPVAVVMDRDGIRPDALAEAARRTGAKLALLVPTLHNPTTTIMSEARRREIVAAAQRLDLILIEDDVYGFLLEDQPTRLATLAHDRVIYVTSASKCLVPGLRVGWAICGNGAITERLRTIAFSLHIAPPGLTGEIICRWIESGIADELVSWQRDEIAERYRLATEIFSSMRTSGHPNSLHMLLHLPEP